MPADRRPHILLITMDELRRDALGCYGAEAVATPGVDSIAAAGVRFDAAWTPSPLCLPARCSILTGLYPHNSRAYSNFRPCALSPELPNLYNRLRAAGYFTAHVGKCHYTPAPYDKTRPDVTQDLERVKDFYLSLGLDRLDLQNGKSNSAWFYNDYSRELEAAGFLDEYRRCAADKLKNERIFAFPGPDEWHPDAWVARKAVEQLRRVSRERPQFLWVSFSGPHYPFDAPESYYARVDAGKVGTGVWREGEWDDPTKVQSRAYHGGAQGLTLAEGKNSARDLACKNYPDDYWRRLRTAYFANVALIDDGIGDILREAERALGPDVLVIFTTDHGEMLGNHRLWGKNGCTYEDVLSVPLVVRGAGFAPGASRARVSLVDLLPTCLAAAGVEPTRTDGRDLRTSMADGGHRYLFSEAEGLAAVSDGRWKYAQSVQRGETMCEAYDLETDPREYVNIARDAAHAREIGELQRVLTGFFMNDFLK